MSQVLRRATDQRIGPPLSRAVQVPSSETECRELVELLDHLTDEIGEDENHSLASLMDVLGVLIEKDEDESFRSWWIDLRSSWSAANWRIRM